MGHSWSGGGNGGLAVMVWWFRGDGLVVELTQPLCLLVCRTGNQT